MPLRLAAISKNDAVDAIASRLDGGTIEHRTGTQPATADTAATGILLGTNTFGSPAFGAATGGVATANAIGQDASADASGVIGYSRCLTSGAAPVLDMDAGQGTGTISFNNTTVVATGTIDVDSMTITAP